MDFSNKVINENAKAADLRVAFTCRLMILFMGIVVVLNLTGIFEVKPQYIYPTAIVSMILFYLPTLFYNNLKIHTKEVRYVVIGATTFVSGLLFCCLNYHTIMFFMFPVIIITLYNKTKYTIYVIIAMIPIMIACHFISFYVSSLPDDPHKTIEEVIFFGMIPRIIQFFALSLACVFITNNTEKLINSLANKNKELYDDQLSTVESLAEVIEAQSSHTGNHIKRVGEYTKVLCNALGFDDETTWKVSLASMMHDIGKISIPKDIIDKPAKLTEEEFEIIKTHVTTGKKMLENCPGEILQLAKDICYHHHEKYDGTGYLKVKGDDIDFNARIVSLADVFDALASTRPYKPKFDCDEAYEIIVSQSGKHFDPVVVEAFVQNYDKFKEIAHQYID